MKLPDIKWSGGLPNGSASQPGKESNHFYIASLDPKQRLGFSLTGVLRKREANRSTKRIRIVKVLQASQYTVDSYASKKDGLAIQRGNPLSNGVFRQFGDAVNVQLVHDLSSMCFNGSDTNVEGGSDFF